jgi:hypothetical protein
LGHRRSPCYVWRPTPRSLPVRARYGVTSTSSCHRDTSSLRLRCRLVSTVPSYLPGQSDCRRIPAGAPCIRPIRLPLKSFPPLAMNLPKLATFLLSCGGSISATCARHSILHHLPVSCCAPSRGQSRRRTRGILARPECRTLTRSRANRLSPSESCTPRVRDLVVVRGQYGIEEVVTGVASGSW